MVMFTSRQGIKVWLEEVFPARGGVMPMVDIGYMRDLAVRRAADAGFEWVLLIDGDTEPEPGMLLKLLDREMPIIAPYMLDPNYENIMLGEPIREPNTGLQPALWVAASCILFRTSVFNCGVTFTGAPGDDLFFRNFWHYGHRPYIDTNVALKLTRGPTRAGAMSWKDRWERLEKNYNRSKELPDRKATDPNSEFVSNGVYAPFYKESRNGNNDKT